MKLPLRDFLFRPRPKKVQVADIDTAITYKELVIKMSHQLIEKIINAQQGLPYVVAQLTKRVVTGEHT